MALTQKLWSPQKLTQQVLGLTDVGHTVPWTSQNVDNSTQQGEAGRQASLLDSKKGSLKGTTELHLLALYF